MIQQVNTSKRRYVTVDNNTDLPTNCLKTLYHLLFVSCYIVKIEICDRLVGLGPFIVIGQRLKMYHCCKNTELNEVSRTVRVTWKALFHPFVLFFAKESISFHF